jgi:hypothetical protein
MFCVFKVEVRAEGDQHDFLSTNWNSTPHRPAEHDKVMTKIDQEYSRSRRCLFSILISVLEIVAM